jgi:hypothetical protein
MGAVTFSIDPELIQTFKQLIPLKSFVETGTFEGETIEQVRDLFEKIHSVELSEDYYTKALERFGDDSKINLYCDASEEILKQLQPSLADEAVLYWLDAHWCVADKTAGYQSQCPLLQELDAIATLNSDSVVLIDDARLFLCPPPHPHEVTQWPSFNSIIKKLHSLSSAHEIMVLNDVILYYPSRLRQPVQEYGHNVAIDWLVVKHKSDYYDSHSSALQEQIKSLTEVTEERGIALLQKESEIQLLSNIAEERQIALLEKEAQIQLLDSEIERLKCLKTDDPDL